MKLKIKKKRLNLLKNIALAISSIVFVLLITEIILRLTIEPYSTNGGTCVASRMFEKYYQLNSKGFRDRDFFYEKGNNTFRILVLGDSIAFGQGIKNVEDTFPKLLEKRLNQNKSSITYEVINTGRQGFNTKSELEFLKEEGIKYDPDLIILTYLFNDAETRPLLAPEATRINENDSIFKKLYYVLYQNTFLFCVLKDHPAVRSSRCIEYISNKIVYDLINYETSSNPMYFDYTNYTLELYKPDNLIEHRKVVENLIDFTQSKNIEVLAVIFPAGIDIPKREYPYLKLHDFIKSVFKDKNVYYIDLIDFFEQARPKSLSVNIVDGHPNELAHKVTAYAIYNKLIKERLIPLSEGNQ